MISKKLLPLVGIFMLYSCKSDNEEACARDIELVDGITINKIVGEWEIAPETKTKVPVGDTHVELPKVINIMAERAHEGNSLDCWEISAENLLGYKSLGIMVDADGGFLGYPGIVVGDVFVALLFRNNVNRIEMMVFSLVDITPSESDRLHVATYYK